MKVLTCFVLDKIKKLINWKVIYSRKNIKKKKVIVYKKEHCIIRGFNLFYKGQFIIVSFNINDNRKSSLDEASFYTV